MPRRDVTSPRSRPREIPQVYGSSGAGEGDPVENAEQDCRYDECQM